MNILTFVGIIVVVLLISTITGTLVWLLWDNTIPQLFSGLVENGYVAQSPDWFDVVKFSWIIGLLFASGSSNSKNN